MAIDTENKRRSVLGIWASTRILPRPVGTIDAADRAHVYIYSGIAIGGGPPFAGVYKLILRPRRRGGRG